MRLDNYGQEPLEIINRFIRDELAMDAQNQGNIIAYEFLAHAYHIIDKELDKRVIGEVK